MKSRTTRIALSLRDSRITQQCKSWKKVNIHLFVYIFKEHDKGIKRLNGEWDKRFTELEDNYFSSESRRS